MKKIFFYLVCCVSLAACNKDALPKKAYVAEEPVPARLDSLRGFTFEQLQTVQFYNDKQPLEMYRYLKKDTSYVRDATAIRIDSLLRVGYELDPLEKGKLVAIENDSAGYVVMESILIVSFAAGRELRYEYSDGDFVLATKQPTSVQKKWSTPPVAIIKYDDKEYGINRAPVALYIDQVALTGKRKLTHGEPGIDLKQEAAKKAAEEKVAKKKKKKDKSPQKKEEEDF